MFKKFKSSLIMLFLASAAVDCALPIKDLPEVNGDKFYYFGYGSNLLEKRIHMQNPSAKRIAPGILEDFRLDFFGYTKRWDGAPATIVPTRNESVHGALWEIDLVNLLDLDNQEGVEEGIYYPASVPVVASNNTLFMARTYLLVDGPKTILKSIPKDKVPHDRQPSKTYLQCLVKGALETGLEPAYIDWLNAVVHNSKVVTELENYLELKDVQLSN